MSWLGDMAGSEHPAAMAAAAALCFEAGMVLRPGDLSGLTPDEIGALVAGRRKALEAAVDTVLSVIGSSAEDAANDTRLEELAHAWVQ